MSSSADYMAVVTYLKENIRSGGQMDLATASQYSEIEEQ